MQWKSVCCGTSWRSPGRGTSPVPPKPSISPSRPCPNRSSSWRKSWASRCSIRGSRRVTLTEYGRLLEQRAREILDIVQRTRDEFTGPREALTGDLRIGAGEGRSVEPVARVMARLHRVYPEVMLHLFTGITGDVISKLDQGLLDFGAINAAANHQAYNYLRLPVEDSWGVLMRRRDDPLSREEAVTVPQILQLPLIVSRHTLLRNELSGWLGRSMQELHIAATCDMPRNASLLVREGAGYLLAYQLPMADDALCFKPLDPPFSSTSHLVWKKNGAAHPGSGGFSADDAGGTVGQVISGLLRPVFPLRLYRRYSPGERPTSRVNIW